MEIHGICNLARTVVKNKNKLNVLKSFYIFKSLLTVSNETNDLKIVLYKTSKQFKIKEYSLILIFIVIGSLFLISSSDLFSIFLSIELQSYGLYIISTIFRNSEKSTSAGITYFLLGSLSSSLILLSSSILYVNSGITYIEGLHIITSISDILNKPIHILNWYQAYYLNICLIILSTGFLFKISAAPFHFWSPYVYDNIPTLVTTFVAVVPKISIFIIFLDLVHFTLKSIYNMNSNWTISLLISSFLSLIIGTIGGLTQFRIKKLYAYSSISHIGFILFALSINSLESIQAFFFYIIQYSISNLNAFIILFSTGVLFFYFKEKKPKNLKEKIYSPIQYINQFKGLFFFNSYLSLSLIITLFSFVGVPPLIGFFGKQMILSAALDKNYNFLTLVAILTSVISAVYYLVVIKQIIFEKPNFNSTLNINIKLASTITIFISIISLIILLYILMPKEYLNMTNILSQIVFNF